MGAGGRGLIVAIVAVAGLALSSGAEANFGDVTQKASPNGCISAINTGGLCVDTTDVSGSRAVAVSPDGSTAYVASGETGGGAVIVFDRAADGTLTRKTGVDGCISDDGTGTACVNGRGLADISDVTVSPDGNTVYAASGDISDGAVAVFDRAADGTLEQLPGTAGCISEDGNGGDCFDGAALAVATSVAVSPDGESVYVTAATSHAVSSFNRAADGSLTQTGCFTDGGGGPGCQGAFALTNAEDVTVSPDGASVYVASPTLNALAIFNRAADGTLTQPASPAGCVTDDLLGGPPQNACAFAEWLRGPSAVTVSPDGRSVYASAQVGDAIVVFDRAPDGTLTQKAGEAGCFAYHLGTNAPPPDRSCTEPFGRALNAPSDVVVAPDGKNVYVASNLSNAVSAIARAADGTLSVMSGPGGCVSAPSVDACAGGSRLDQATGVTVAPDGDSVYVASIGGVAVLDRERDCTITGTAGGNKLTGTAGDDVICGLGGADKIAARGGNDVIFGDSGNDRLVSGAGVDELNGGSGSGDLAYFGREANQAVEANLGTGTVANDGRGNAEMIVGVERAQGAGNQTNSLTGDSGPNVLIGGRLADLLDGAAGGDLLRGERERAQSGAGDTLAGAEGDDTLFPGLGTNDVVGGTGADMLNYGALAVPTGVTVSLLSGAGSTVGAVTDTVSGVESVSGTPNADNITAQWNGVASAVRGRAGDDLLNTSDGDGDDLINGSEGTNTCTADGGDSLNRC